MRGVECKSADGRHSAKCDPLTKPISVQQCSTGVSCDGGGGTIILGSSGPLASSDDGDLDEDDEEDDDDSADVDDVEGGADDSSDVRNGDADLASYHDESAPQYAHRSVSHLHHEEPQQPRAERLTGGGGGYGYHSNSDPESEVPAGDPSSQNTRRKQQGARESNRRSKSDQTQSVDGDILENESQLVQQVGENCGGAPKSTSASNGGSHANVLLAMPYFQALLSNLQKLGKSTGHRMLLDKDLQFGIDLEIFEQDEALGAQIDTKDLLTLTTSDAFASSSLTAAEDTNDGSSFTNSNTDGNEWHEPEATDHISTITTTTTMLPTIGKAVDTTHEADSPHSPHARWQKQGEPETATAAATSNHVTYEWRISDWSECSERCGNAGGAGFGRRLRHHMPTHNALESHVEADVETIDNAYCEDYGLSIPDTFKICGEEECARWEAGEWTLCQRSRCFGRNTAIQKSDVKCRYANGTEAMEACSLSQRPISRQECYSERCKGVWRVDPWSEPFKNAMPQCTLDEFVQIIPLTREIFQVLQVQCILQLKTITIVKANRKCKSQGYSAKQGQTTNPTTRKTYTCHRNSKHINEYSTAYQALMEN